MSFQRLFLVMLLSSLAGTALASGGGPPAYQRSAQVAKAEKLIKAKKWDDAIQVLTQASQTDGDNADVYNWLGYAERNRGNTDAAFKYYERALQLDPKHRGAHEYVGEAYLLVGNVAKAEEHLATLGKLCRSSCEEFKDLEKSIEAYNQSHAS